MIIELRDGTLAVWPPSLLVIDPEETCANCGYRIGDHDLVYPCPDEHQVVQRWGRQ